MPEIRHYYKYKCMRCNVEEERQFKDEYFEDHPPPCKATMRFDLGATLDLGNIYDEDINIYKEWTGLNSLSGDMCNACFVALGGWIMDGGK